MVVLSAALAFCTGDRAGVLAAERVLDAGWHHVRIGGEREWTSFPEQAEGDHLRVTFIAEPNEGEQTLRLRHRDLKQTWKVALNGRALGTLPSDENDMVTFWSVPPNTLRAGDNEVRVFGSGKAADDIQVGDVRLIDRPRSLALNEARLTVTVTEADNGPLIPARITIIDKNRSLMSLGTTSSKSLAVRPGVVYTSNGRAQLDLPAGEYTVFAGRGFEYGVDSTTATIGIGANASTTLAIRREVATPGYVSCDTHCHTLTHSGHGDATLAERMITIAAEGIELPIATDHNIQIDYESAAREAGVRRYFTPVIGNEVTTPRLGHFNVFPVARGAAVIDHKGADWSTIFKSIRAAPEVEVVVLNHARDLHGGFRPFGPQQHIGPAGENLDGWTLEANALEVINSGALQSDPLQLFRDWFGLLNRGMSMTPVGASDSHDVARHFVGQGRTYIQCDDRDPSQINVREACQSIRDGRVLVSLGLLAEIEVEERFHPGDLATVEGDLDVRVHVRGPGWSKLSHVTLYMNGVPVRDAEIPEPAAKRDPGGVIWTGAWSLARPRHDVHLAAIATGPGVTEPYWPIPKSYQPTSPDWRPYVLAATGVVRVDADRSGTFTSAFEYAGRAVESSGGNFVALLNTLSEYDEAVAIQAASRLRIAGTNLLSPTSTAALLDAAPAVRRGFDEYITHWKQSAALRAAP